MVPMMGYGGSMMWGSNAFGVITWIVVIVDLVFLGIWLWKKISQ